MKTQRDIDFEGRTQHSIHIGGVFASIRPTVVKTVLGSCISVCLRDPVTRVGGMNHFMLPDAGEGEAASTRYGVYAMELLINECMKAGADRRRLEAKVFGGGHVLWIRESEENVPQRNMRFALQFLDTESIPIISRDIGGYATRSLLFFTDSGRALLKKMQRDHDTERRAMEELRSREQEKLREITRTVTPEDDSNITLF